MPNSQMLCFCCHFSLRPISSRRLGNICYFKNYFQVFCRVYMQWVYMLLILWMAGILWYRHNSCTAWLGIFLFWQWKSSGQPPESFRHGKRAAVPFAKNIVCSWKLINRLLLLKCWSVRVLKGSSISNIAKCRLQPLYYCKDGGMGLKIGKPLR